MLFCVNYTRHVRSKSRPENVTTWVRLMVCEVWGMRANQRPELTTMDQWELSTEHRRYVRWLRCGDHSVWASQRATTGQRGERPGHSNHNITLYIDTSYRQWGEWYRVKSDQEWDIAACYNIEESFLSGCDSGPQNGVDVLIFCVSGPHYTWWVGAKLDRFHQIGSNINSLFSLP